MKKLKPIQIILAVIVASTISATVSAGDAVERRDLINDVTHLKSTDYCQRFTACWFLGQAGEQAKFAAPALTAVLVSDAHADIRAEAIHALAKFDLNAEAVVPYLSMALTDQGLEVRYQAMLALKRYGPEALIAVPKVIEILRHDELDQVAAAELLASIGNRSPEVIEALQEVMTAPESSECLRRAAADSLRKLNQTRQAIESAKLGAAR